MNVLFLYDKMDLPETQLNARLFDSGEITGRVLCNTSGGNHKILSDAGYLVETLICKSRIDVKAISQLRQVLKQQTFDAVHAFTAKTLSNVLFSLIGLQHKPKIIAYRGAIGNVSKIDPMAWCTYLHPSISMITCVSEAVRQYLLSVGLASDKLVTIYKGHEVSWYETQRPKSLNEMGVPEGSFVISCVANMRKNKGVDVLLKAAIACSDIANLHIVLIGEVRDSKVLELTKDRKIQGRVHLLGYRSDAVSFLRESDVFVMPSRDREGLPKAVIEAMSVSVCPVVTSVGGMPELVDNDLNGLVIPPNDIDALAKALRYLHQQPDRRKELGIKAKNKIESNFHINQTVEKTLALYRNVVGDRSKGACENVGKSSIH